MAVNLRKLSTTPDQLSSGHRLCGGCGASIIMRQILHATDKPVVVGCATGCLEVTTTMYPQTAWKTSFIHSAFENSAATVSGVEAAYNALRRKGKVDSDFVFMAVGGDGGTFDIGFQSLSGAMERGHKMLYVCYDNEGYMNTGIQRSSATPFGAATTTTPAGKKIPGKLQFRKDLTAVIAAHHVAYVAQASPSRWRDLIEKAQKAFEADGPAFLNILSPCPRGWRTEPSQSIRLAELAVQTCYWPLYEVEHGDWRITYTPKEKVPLTEFLKPQGRFRHLFKPGNERLLEQAQEHVDREWERLQLRVDACGRAISD